MAMREAVGAVEDWAATAARPQCDALRRPSGRSCIPQMAPRPHERHACRWCGLHMGHVCYPTHPAEQDAPDARASCSLCSSKQPIARTTAPWCCWARSARRASGQACLLVRHGCGAACSRCSGAPRKQPKGEVCAAHTTYTAQQPWPPR
eukprot:352176-Chlamydomonas_euryale.AAC.6